jgi:hypothetical protein
LLDSKNAENHGGKSEMDYMMVKNHLNTYSEKKGRTTKLVIPEKNENNVNS